MLQAETGAPHARTPRNMPGQISRKCHAILDALEEQQRYACLLWFLSQTKLIRSTKTI